MPYLDKIESPADLKQIPADELDALCAEIRQELIAAVSCNGGHLASNLGVVELTVAMHRVFNSPSDQFVWDVGHQAYTHKLLTGRYGKFRSLRTEGGLSGFTRPVESEHDIFSSGHSSTSVSAASGLAKAKQLKNDKGSIVAVIGDGALTGGLVYEAFNNAARENNNLIVILNDNKMSISENVGSMAKHLAVLRSNPAYNSFKSGLEKVLSGIPLIGRGLLNGFSSLKKAVRKRLLHSTFFEDFGFRYYGPLDGHDINVLTDALTVAKKQNHAVLIHINTIKGKGYNPAEKNPTQFHGIGKFDIETGEPLSSGVTFSEAFGIAMSDFAGKDSRICAITAAMAEGTGLKSFAGAYPDKFFDVGIAEPHAVTFASGLARNGMLPVFAVYSTFFQRCYDQLVHDCAMQDLKVIFAVDRAGFVGEDGESHQGVFDVAFMNSIPNLSVYAPSNFEELRSAMYYSFYKEKYMTAVRYPRGPEASLPEDYEYNGEACCVYGPEEAKCAIITYGRLFANACRAKARLEENGLTIKIIKLNKIKPIAPDAVAAVKRCERVYFYEEALKSGGCGEKFAALLLESGFQGRYRHIAVADEFIKQASVSSQLTAYRLDADSMAEEVANDTENEA